jgi:hypothetical protein
MAGLDTNRIKRRIRKMQQLLKLAEDPEMVELFLEMVSADAPKPAEATKTQGKGAPRANGTTQRGELEKVARKAIHALQATFNSGDLIRAVKASGYTFTAKDEGIAISGVLKRLVKKKVIKRMDDEKSKRHALYGLAA